MQIDLFNVPIAFFDLDDTLIKQDSNTLWLKWRMNKNIFGIVELIIGLLNYIYYKRGKLTAKKMNLYYWARTIGINSELYKKMSKKFFDIEGKKNIYKEAIDIIKTYKENGVHIVIITGQDDFVTYPFFKYLNIDGYISNKRIIKNKKFVGFESPNCYGEGKIILAEKYAKKNGIKLEDCSFFSDSISDFPLLNEVKYPVVVNPDLELLKIAQEKKWTICNFTK